jgi:hypothetical protein
LEANKIVGFATFSDQPTLLTEGSVVSNAWNDILVSDENTIYNVNNIFTSEAKLTLYRHSIVFG